MQRLLRYRYLHPLALASLTIALACTSIIAQMRIGYGTKIVDLIDAHRAPFGIVLGASVKRDGTPSDALRDRLLVAARLYKAGKVTRLLVTGDDGKFHVDEVSSMKRILMAEGVPTEDILVDGHGYRTYESCKRAVQRFGIKQGIIVTQRFHLPRALYLCAQLGMDVQGVASDLQTYQRILFFTLRDFGASFKAWWDVNVSPPHPPVQYVE
jgi:vancomycin permeability regulator SanA